MRLPGLVRTLAPALLLATATLLAHASALRGDFIWDDDANVSHNEALRSIDGLRRIWLEPGTTTQYYPLLYTTFWGLYRAFGDEPTGYHALNWLLQALNALLLWRVLVRLGVPGAWWGAALWALHPVAVESVAWITELKNLQSGAFALAAALAFARFDEARERGASGALPFGLALVAFAAAVASKTVTATLPGALLVALWWKRGKLRARDFAAVVPMAAVVAPLAFLTVGAEARLGENRGFEWAPDFTEQLLVAGRALWFYAARLLWPHPLGFVYPRFEVDPSSARDWLAPLAALAVVAAALAVRHRTRGPAATLLFYGGMLLPALGFLEIYYFRFASTADHWQYLAAIGPCALAGAGLARLRPPAAQRAVGVAVLVVLGSLTFARARVFASSETLFADSLTAWPDSVMARYNLAVLVERRGDDEAAERHYREVLERQPGHLRALNNLGLLALRHGRGQEALALLGEATRRSPVYVEAYWNLGTALERLGRPAAALRAYRRSLAIDPRAALHTLGRGAFEGVGRAHLHVASLLVRSGHAEQAILYYENALRLEPGLAAAYLQLGVVRARLGQRDAAIALLREAARLAPDDPRPRRHLARLGVAPRPASGAGPAAPPAATVAPGARGARQ